MHLSGDTEHRQTSPQAPDSRMAYDPYKSLLANASREHLKRSADLNTHLVGNVFLPAIDSQHKKLSKSTASLKHLKVIEQCILAENKREERLAKCATIKDRRILTKKFQAQRERERELIQALMLGNHSERHHDIKLLETETIVATTPRQQLNQETTGLSARVPAPDRVFRKADVTGGAPKAKPHAYKKFKLPECNGSPGKKADVSAQMKASTKLSSSSRKAPPSVREFQTGNSESPTRKKRSPPRSAGYENSVKSPTQYGSPNTTKDDVMAEAVGTTETSPTRRTQSPYISPQRHQSKVARAPHLSTLPSKPTETEYHSNLVKSAADNGDQQPKNSSVAFEGALSFSEAQRMAMGSELNQLKARCDKILAEIATQTTPRLQGDAVKDDSIKKAMSRTELPPMNPPPLDGELSQDISVTTPRRPHSSRATRSTRQAFLDSLAMEPKMPPREEEPAVQSSDSASVSDAGTKATHDQQILAEGEVNAQASVEEQSTVDSKVALDPADDSATTEAEYSEDGDHTAENGLPDVSVGADPDPDVNEDDELETDVAETLFDLVDLVEAAIAEQDQQKALPSPRTVSPRPRSSMGRTTKHVLHIQSVFRGYRARIAFRLALYEDALSCGVLGAMPGTIQGRSGWYLDPKRLMAYYFEIPEPDGDWEQKYTLRCSRLVLTPYEMQQEVLSKVPAMLQQNDEEQEEQ